ncbi:hypothetical protein DICVIV_11019 [Dictyocaulus viviparus]|uniref:Diphthine--ammonia ligase n=1 Tax=Dictyocaulus viviparus TaxID=29172 RepID=A0A0D8XEB1_DICVI|nr:hypothetical protein DICVIV_11019 [Dictyocaulus viviparus]
MACGLALKRPHEYDSYLADETFPHEAKRARHTTAHCSPFRPQMGTIAANLPSTSSFAQAVSKDDSPFAAVAGKCQLSESQLDAYLRSEVRNGQRRKLIPRRNCLDVNPDDENTPRNDYRIPNSPPQSGSDSDGESSSLRKSVANNYQALADKPQFSLKQVRMICERLLKEQEMRLRYEYEIALSQKLDEQHEQYVQFANEQLVSQYKENASAEFSYLSTWYSSLSVVMDIVGLVSGGKDSCYNMMCAVDAGHRIVALANLHSGDRGELDSYMYQSVGTEGVATMAEAMCLPLYRKEIVGTAINKESNYYVRIMVPMLCGKEIHLDIESEFVLPTAGDEVEDLYELLKIVKNHHPSIRGVSVGAILSNYQKLRVENICERLDLVPLCYLWEREQKGLLREMLSRGLDAILIKVAAIGLDKSHIGMKLSEMELTLNQLNSQFGVHPCGEGGEYETFVYDCPLFQKSIDVVDSEIVTHQDDPIAPVHYLRLLKLRLTEKLK